MSTVLLANDREKANEKLLTAIRSNRLDAIHAALGAGASPNTSDSRGASALMYAVLYSDPTIVSLLLLRGAQPNHSDADGASPLLWAVNDVLKTRMLLQAGANVNVTSKFGMTPILVASAWPNNAAVVRLLLAHGADPKAAGGGGETTLTRATYLGDVQTVELLLTVGVDPNVKGFAGRTPLMNAVQRGDRRMVAALLRSGADVRATDAKQQSVLIRNGYWNDARIVQSLIDRGLDVSTPDSQGRDALLFAAASETATEEVVRMLLRHGAKVGAKNSYGDTAVDEARRSGNFNLVRLLGATPEALKVDSPPVLPRAISATQSVAQSMKLLAASSPSIFTNGRCTSCHHQSLPSLAAAHARQAGVDTSALREVNRKGVAAVLQRQRSLLLQAIGPAGEGYTVGWALVGLKADGYAPDIYTDAAVAYVAATQMKNGSWFARFGRPPLEYSTISATAINLRALRDYQIPGRKADFDKRIRQAVRWLERAKPSGTEEKAMRLLGLVWGGGSRDRIEEAARALRREQRPDGGWGQLVTLPSDAYATGQALVALHAAEPRNARESFWSRGVHFLMSTQFPDGSWLVRGRSLPVQPHFESGFPHGRDQWISAAGTSWAAMALSLAAQGNRQ
jgi:ankyrin repeat protein